MKAPPGLRMRPRGRPITEPPQSDAHWFRARRFLRFSPGLRHEVTEPRRPRRGFFGPARSEPVRQNVEAYEALTIRCGLTAFMAGPMSVRRGRTNTSSKAAPATKSQVSLGPLFSPGPALSKHGRG
jgi:hypothetical protein